MSWRRWEPLSQLTAPLTSAALASRPSALASSQLLVLNRPIVLLADRSRITHSTCLVTAGSESSFCGADGKREIFGALLKDTP